MKIVRIKAEGGRKSQPLLNTNYGKKNIGSDCEKNKGLQMRKTRI